MSKERTFVLKKERKTKLKLTHIEILYLRAVAFDLSTEEIVHLLYVTKQDIDRYKNNIEKRFKEDLWLLIIKKSYNLQIINKSEYASTELVTSALIYVEKFINMSFLKDKSRYDSLNKVMDLFKIFIKSSQEMVTIKYRESMKSKKEILSDSEIELLYFMYRGFHSEYVKAKMNISSEQLINNLKRIQKKMKVNTSFMALKKALYLGILSKHLVFFSLYDNKLTVFKTSESIKNYITSKTLNDNQIKMLIFELLKRAYTHIEFKYLCREEEILLKMN